MGYHLIKAEKQIAFYADFILNVVTRMGKTKQSQVCTNKKKRHSGWDDAIFKYHNSYI